MEMRSVRIKRSDELSVVDCNFTLLRGLPTNAYAPRDSNTSKVYLSLFYFG